MRILIVNDDGIKAPGIRKLAELSMQLGEVWVVAPKSQCSAMSQRITLFEDIEVTPECYDVDGVRAYSVGGTPADCVKVALEFLMPEKPDVVFSGINSGYNTGIDILYSGTVGAAMEALANGIRSFAFSNKNDTSWETADAYLISIVKELLDDFGEDRVVFMIANTVQYYTYEDWFSKENEKWAGEIDIPENFNRGIDINSRYIIDGDVSILNEVVNELRAMI